MNFAEQLLTVWRALLANKTRSFLTLLGVIMGVGTIVLLSSVVGGGLAAIGRAVQQASGDDMIKVYVSRWTAEGSQHPPLTAGDMGAISGASGLDGATVLPQLDARLDARGGGESLRSWLVGTNEGAPGFYQLELASGRFLSSFDRARRARVAVIGQDVSKQLLGGASEGEISVGGERYRVVGVLTRKPSLNVGNRTWNNAVAIPDTTFMAWRGAGEIDTILVKTNAAEGLSVKLPLVSHTIRTILEARAHPGKTLNVEDGSNRKSGEKGFLQALQLLLVAVAVLCLGVGGINIMNIMLVTVTERTREIGLRIALGARQRDIRRQFLFEAAAIAGLGGVLGVLGGLVTSWAISRLLTSVLGFWPWVVDPVAITVAFASALATGLVFGWYPAKQAASLQPIECLRFE